MVPNSIAIHPPRSRPPGRFMIADAVRFMSAAAGRDEPAVRPQVGAIVENLSRPRRSAQRTPGTGRGISAAVPAARVLMPVAGHDRVGSFWLSQAKRL